MGCGGFTESLAQEVAPFGVKVCALEPGGMRTNWGARANKDTPDLLPDYELSVGAVISLLRRASAPSWKHLPVTYLINIAVNEESETDPLPNS
jgi:NAD(P)-dependent dehydrogenase (short-subunit alcohol dehydrogenase family)